MNQFFQRSIAAAAAALALTAGLAAGAAETQSSSMPILMYHNLTQDPNKTSSMTITDERFRLDMEFLASFGYTPLFPSEVEEIGEGKRSLPARPVMITFDDGYLSNYTIAAPILQQTGMKATVALIASHIKDADDTDSSRHSLNWNEVKSMYDSGRFQFGSHTYDLHNPKYGGANAPDGINGIMREKGESQSQYTERVGNDLAQSISLIKQHTGQTTVNYFSYPYGAYDRWMQPILEKNGIKISTLTNAGMARPTYGLYNLPRYGIRMDRTVPMVLRQRVTAAPTTVTVSLNGKKTTLQAYSIGDENYVRVRDAALLLSGCEWDYAVGWSEEEQQVTLSPREQYTPIGTENKVLSPQKRTVQSVTEPTIVEGQSHMIAAFCIDDYNYYRLRSLASVCGFDVDWDEANQTVKIVA